MAFCRHSRRSLPLTDHAVLPAPEANGGKRECLETPCPLAAGRRWCHHDRATIDTHIHPGRTSCNAVLGIRLRHVLRLATQDFNAIAVGWVEKHSRIILLCFLCQRTRN